MPCKQCIFQEITASLSSSSKKTDTDDERKERCQKCLCNGSSSVDRIGEKAVEGKTGTNKPKPKYASKPTGLKGLVITDPIVRLIMETFPVKIEWSENYGRYLVATRNIQRQELIFQVEPIVAGPTPSYTEKDWICMACFRIAKKKTMVRCSDCQWPFCSESCSDVSFLLNEKWRMMQRLHRYYYLM